MGQSALWKYAVRIAARRDDPLGLAAYGHDMRTPEIPANAAAPVPLAAFVVMTDANTGNRNRDCIVRMSRMALHVTAVEPGDGWSTNAAPAQLNLVFKRSIGCDATTITGGSLLWTPPSFQALGATGNGQYIVEFSGVLCEAFELWAMPNAASQGPVKLGVTLALDRDTGNAVRDLGPGVTQKP